MTHRVPTDRAARSRSRRAILAGGAVLGLGAAATLAGWTDNTWVESTFTTTPFGIEAAVDTDGNDWQDYSESPGGALGFSVATSGLLPGESAYAPLNLRLTQGEADTSIRLDTPPSAPTGNSFDQAFFNALELTLYEAAPSSCTQSGIGSTPPIDDFDEVGVAHDTDDVLVTLPGDGDPVGVCFRITLPADVGPEVRGGTTGQLVWTFTGEPQS